MNLPTGLTQMVGKQMLAAKQASPQAFFAVGVIGVVGSTVLACRATLKLNETLDDIKDDISIVQQGKSIELANRAKTPEEIERDYNRTLTLVYIKGAGKVTKLYGPAVILGSLSIASLTGSHVALVRRNAALTAAYGALQTTLDQYRARVRDAVGEEKERHIYYDASKQDVVLDDGKTKKVLMAGKSSMYARCFDESNPNWQRNVEMNRYFLQTQHNFLDWQFNNKGHLFLNEVYDALGFDRTEAGNIVGWVKDSEGGDNYLDFGLFDVHNDDFMHGPEQSVWLDFNVDGPILSKIEKP